MQMISVLKTTAAYFGDLAALSDREGDADNAGFWAAKAKAIRDQIDAHKRAIARTMKVIEADRFGPARDCSIIMLRLALTDAGLTEELARIDQACDENWPSDNPFIVLLAELEQADG